MYESRNFVIFSLTEIDEINFSQVLETSADTLRKSVDGTKSFIKWDGETPPPSVQALTTVEGPYTYVEILDILSAPEWSAPMPMDDPILVRARNADGTFMADDPATPNVNEAWEEA